MTPRVKKKSNGDIWLKIGGFKDFHHFSVAALRKATLEWFVKESETISPSAITAAFPACFEVVP